MKTKKKIDEPLKTVVVDNPLLYAVLKLQTVVQIDDLLSGLTHEVKVVGAEGYIPVYKTMEEAEKSACDGKYRIVSMSV